MTFSVATLKHEEGSAILSKQGATFSAASLDINCSNDNMQKRFNETVIPLGV